MLELLFNASFWYGLLIAAIVIVIVWICGKYPSARVFVLTGVVIVVSVVLLGGSIYCGVNLNAYYNERGGIFGAITGIFETNTSEVVDEMDIKINNIELIQENGDVYTATIMIDKVLDIDDGTQYGIYVNDNFIENINNPNYTRAEYTYTFQNNSLTELLTDTLILDFAFDSTSTTLIVTTNGGVDAVSYWNSYFNKNNFIISIEESNYNPGNDLTYTDGEVEEFYKVDYYLEDSLLFSQLYTAGSNIDLPYLIYAEEWKILNTGGQIGNIGGSITGGTYDEAYTTINESYIVNSDIKVYAKQKNNLVYSNVQNVIGDALYYFTDNEDFGTGILKYNPVNDEYEYLTYSNYWIEYENIKDAEEENQNVIASILRADNGTYWYLSDSTFEMLDLTDNDFQYFDNYEFLYNNKLIYSNENGGLYLFDIFTNSTTQIYQSGVWDNFRFTFSESTGKYTNMVITSSAEDSYYLRYNIETNTISVIESGSVGI